MVCWSSCGVAAALLGGMLYIMLTKDNNILAKFEGTFTEEQKRMYLHIQQMRRKIWTKGMFLGFLLGFALMYFNPLTTNDRNVKGCTFAATVMLVNYFYYMLAPKSSHMIDYLRKDQIDEWKDVGRMFQVKYHVGALIGILGCYILGRQL